MFLHIILVKQVRFVRCFVVNFSSRVGTSYSKIHSTELDHAIGIVRGAHPRAYIKVFVVLITFLAETRV